MKLRAGLPSLFLSLALASCAGIIGKETSERDRLQYEYVQQVLDQLPSGVTSILSESDLAILRELTLDYDEDDLAEEDKAKFKQLAERLHSLKARWLERESQEGQSDQDPISQGGNIVSLHRKLLSQVSYYPIYLYEGDELNLSASSEDNVQLSLINYDAHRTVLSKSGHQVDLNLQIPYEAIYLLEVKPKQGHQYVTLKAGYRSSKTQRPRVVETMASAQKGGFLAIPETKLEMKPLFEEPKKIALRGQLKAAFSGHYRSIISLPVPPKTEALLYSLRISSNENVVSTDGAFPNRLQTSYSRHKIFGLTLYEREGGRGANSLLNLMLGDTRPPREEDAYCNFYVFPKRQDAKRWQDGGAGGEQFAYDVDQSQLGTQSCNGRLKPAKGQQSIYLGFENERFRYDTYIWLEVVSLSERTSYMRPIYKIRK